MRRLNDATAGIAVFGALEDVDDDDDSDGKKLSERFAENQCQRRQLVSTECTSQTRYEYRV